MMDMEWENEPDRKEFKHLGFDCLINRNHFGAWCGYVAVPKNHPWFEKTYQQLEDLGVSPEVHGGLTYSEHCQGEICHKTDGEDDVWWLGFDCNHAFDFAPGGSSEARKISDMFFFSNPLNRVKYRNMDYAMEETMKLAQQICLAG